jgi:predicted esterase YcpF (UPF0227 family)
MILFIHGFGSCGWGEKSLALRRHFGVEQVLAPDLPLNPRHAIRHLEDLLGRYRIHALVGSSLGGFFATWLNRDARLPSVLVNPVVHPHRLLAQYSGPQRRWCDDMPFTVDHDYLAALQQLDRAAPGDAEPYLVLLQQGDEVLDYRDAAAYYRDKTLRQIEGGNHRFAHFNHYLPLIDDWIGAHSEHHGKETQTPA